MDLIEPPCCIINTFMKCDECGWRTCEQHWYDAPKDKSMFDYVKHVEPILDKYHIPTYGDEDTGICIRCKGIKWTNIKG